MGDLNCDLLDTSTSARKDRILEMLRSFSLEQFVAQPTYSAGSLLDVVICNTGDVVQRVGVFKCAFSPHSLIRALLCLPKGRRKPRKIRTRLFKSIDHLGLLQDLHFVDWSGVFSRPSVHDQWSYNQPFDFCSRLARPAQDHVCQKPPGASCHLGDPVSDGRAEGNVAP